jgi:integrase
MEPYVKGDKKMNENPNYTKQLITNHGAPVKEAGRTPELFTGDELTGLFNPERYTDKALRLYYVCCFTGALRTGKARGLRGKQVLFDREALVVDGSVTSDGTRIKYQGQGTEAHPKFRMVPLPDITLNLLREHLAEHRLSEDGFIFKGQREPDKPITARYVNDNLKRVMGKAGIEPKGRKLAVQSLRSMYITFIRRVVPPDLAMKPVEHKIIRITDYYRKRLAGEPLAELTRADAAANLFR